MSQPMRGHKEKVGFYMLECYSKNFPCPTISMQYMHDFRDYYLYTSVFPVEEGSHPHYRFQHCKLSSLVSLDPEVGREGSLVMRNVGALGATTSGSGEIPFHIIRAPTLDYFDNIDQDQLGTFQMVLLNRLLGNIQSRSKEVLEIARECKDKGKKGRTSRSGSQQLAPPASNLEATPKATGTEDLSTFVIDLTEHILFVVPLQKITKKEYWVFQEQPGSSSATLVSKVIPTISIQLSMGNTALPALPPPHFNLPIKPISLTEEGKTYLEALENFNNKSIVSASTSSKLKADRLIHAIFSRQVSLMAERHYSMAIQQAYELKVLRAERANPKKRREEAIKDIVEGNTIMDTMIKQRKAGEAEQKVIQRAEETKAKLDSSEKAHEESQNKLPSWKEKTQD
uniref:Uncharacterized protein n=1 Tax=Cannabis sativa TaxID=3483 RepID=A0A803NL04_CANSA